MHVGSTSRLTSIIITARVRRPAAQTPSNYQVRFSIPPVQTWHERAEAPERGSGAVLHSQRNAPLTRLANGERHARQPQVAAGSACSGHEAPMHPGRDSTSRPGPQPRPGTPTLSLTLTLPLALTFILTWRLVRAKAVGVRARVNAIPIALTATVTSTTTLTTLRPTTPCPPTRTPSPRRTYRALGSSTSADDCRDRISARPRVRCCII